MKSKEEGASPKRKCRMLRFRGGNLGLRVFNNFSLSLCVCVCLRMSRENRSNVSLGRVGLLDTFRTTFISMGPYSVTVERNGGVLSQFNCRGPSSTNTVKLYQSVELPHQSIPESYKEAGRFSGMASCIWREIRWTWWRRRPGKCGALSPSILGLEHRFFGFFFFCLYKKPHWLVKIWFAS